LLGYDQWELLSSLRKSTKIKRRGAVVLLKVKNEIRGGFWSYWQGKRKPPTKGKACAREEGRESLHLSGNQIFILGQKISFFRRGEKRKKGEMKVIGILGQRTL